MIKEASGSGKGTITFQVSSAFLAFQAVDDRPPTRWIKEKKCADGAFILFGDDETHLHIVEMKSGLRLKDWQHVRLQFKGMLLNAYAIKGLIDLDGYSKVTCYIAYSRDLLSPATPTTPVLRKFQLGTNKPLADIGDWLSGTIQLEKNITADIIKIKRDANGNGSHVVS